MGSQLSQYQIWINPVFKMPTWLYSNFLYIYIGWLPTISTLCLSMDLHYTFNYFSCIIDFKYTEISDRIVSALYISFSNFSWLILLGYLSISTLESTCLVPRKVLLVLSLWLCCCVDYNLGRTDILIMLSLFSMNVV